MARPPLWLSKTLLTISLVWMLVVLLAFLSTLAYPIGLPPVVTTTPLLAIVSPSPWWAWLFYPAPSGAPRCLPSSLLSIAARRSETDGLRELLAWGAIVGATDACGATPLHYAALGTGYDSIAMLLYAGADPVAKDVYGRTPLDVATPRARLALLHNAPGAFPESAAAYFDPQLAGGRDKPAEDAAAAARADELGFGSLVAVDRWPAGTLTVDEFRSRYAVPRRPVVLEGMADVMFPARPLTRELLAETCGRAPVALVRHVHDAATWAGLEDVELDHDVTLTHLLADAISPEPDAELEGSHLFDWSFIGHCRDAVTATNFTIPAHFAADLFQALDPVASRCSRCLFWPSLFVQQGGTHSGMHQDARHTHFWQLLVDGAKEWLIFPPTEVGNLYLDVWRSSLSFDVDGFAPDPEAYPRIANASGWHVKTKPGDLLFIPAHSPHQVANIDAPIALSSNYVDATNYVDYRDDVHDSDASDALKSHVAALERDAAPAFAPATAHKPFLGHYRPHDLTLGEYHQLVAVDRAREFGLRHAVLQGIIRLKNILTGGDWSATVALD